MRLTFRDFYEAFYKDQARYWTVADGLRTVLHAYRNYRHCQGLPTEIADPERERTFADALEYHIGACELAEFVGDDARARKHQEEFLKTWEAWFHELRRGGTGPPQGNNYGRAAMRPPSKRFQRTRQRDRERR